MRGILRIVIVGFTLTAWTGVAQGQSGYDLFQQALVKERSNGQIQDAIELYRTIIKEHASDRALTAKALVQMGRAYEKLGSREAQQAYERVVREYADQKDMVTEARTRLSAILKASAPTAPPTMAARQVWTGPKVDFLGSISPDGRYLAFPDYESGNLAVHDFATGENRTITSEGFPTAYVEVSKWSPDGKQLAYTRQTGMSPSTPMRWFATYLPFRSRKRVSPAAA